MKITRKRFQELIAEVVQSMLLQENTAKYTTSQISAAVKRALEIVDIDSNTLVTYLTRISRTESGMNPKGLEGITHHIKNPFQLDPPAIENVKKNINMRRWREFIDNKKSPNPANLNQKIEEQDYNSVISNATLSALFAILYILWSAKAWNPANRKTYDYDSKIGTSIEAQAKTWKSKYNTVSGKGKETDFIAKNSQ